MRRSIREGTLEVHWRGNPPEEFVSIVALLIWLIQAGRVFKAMFKSLCDFVAFVIERGPHYDRCSDDALLHAPVPKGPTRARRLDPQLRDAVGHMLSKGELGRTGSQCSALLARVRKWKVKAFGPTSADRAMEDRVAWYYHESQQFFSRGDLGIVSCALDATRMNYRDTLYCALYSPHLKLATWCPPQAKRLDGACQFARFSVRTCLPFLAVSCCFPFVVAVVCRFSPRIVQNSFAVLVA